MKAYIPAITLLSLCLICPEASIPPLGCGTVTPPQASLFHFTHANIPHLILNAIFLLRFKPRWGTTVAAYIIATLCAAIPFMAVSRPTCGISAMCFAMQARHDVAWHLFNWPLMLCNAALLLAPMFNCRMHLASYAISLITWKIIYQAKKR